MNIYHVNPETGEPGLCVARVQCRYGGAPHYESVEAARRGFEAQQVTLARRPAFTVDRIRFWGRTELHEIHRLSANLRNVWQKNPNHSFIVETPQANEAYLHMLSYERDRGWFQLARYSEEFQQCLLRRSRDLNGVLCYAAESLGHD